MNSGAIFTVRLSTLIDEGFDFGLTSLDYPLFSETFPSPLDPTQTYRQYLNKKILEHYYYYEIGMETEEAFHFVLNRRMRENMPFFNQRYLSQVPALGGIITFDPISTVDIATTTTATSDTTATESNTGNANNRHVESDTPQTQLSGNMDYASRATDDTATTDDTRTGSTNINNNSSVSSLGYSGNASLLLEQFRETFLNIDMEVVNSLANLFMGVWENGDSFTQDSAFAWPGLTGWPY